MWQTSSVWERVNDEISPHWPVGTAAWIIWFNQMR